MMGFFSWTDIIATSAVITNIAQFLSGTVISHQYIRKKSTGDTSGFPFICGFLCCFLWLRYGLLTNEDSVFLVNLVGTILFFGYTVVFYVFTVNKALTIRQFSVVCLVIVSVLSFTSYESDIEKAAHFVGVLCCIVTIVFIAAPLTLLFHVIKTGNTESLPFPLILTSVFVSLLWFIYGWIIEDIFLQLTNFIGFVISFAQLMLFVVYPRRSVSGPSYKQLDQSVVF